jgi:hypothetical protein
MVRFEGHPRQVEGAARDTVKNLWNWKIVILHWPQTLTLYKFSLPNAAFDNFFPTPWLPNPGATSPGGKRLVGHVPRYRMVRFEGHPRQVEGAARDTVKNLWNWQIVILHWPQTLTLYKFSLSNAAFDNFFPTPWLPNPGATSPGGKRSPKPICGSVIRFCVHQKGRQFVMG